MNELRATENKIKISNGKNYGQGFWLVESENSLNAVCLKNDDDDDKMTDRLQAEMVLENTESQRIMFEKYNKKNAVKNPVKTNHRKYLKKQSSVERRS